MLETNLDTPDGILAVHVSAADLRSASAARRGGVARSPGDRCVHVVAMGWDEHFKARWHHRSCSKNHPKYHGCMIIFIYIYICDDDDSVTKTVMNCGDRRTRDKSRTVILAVRTVLFLEVPFIIAMLSLYVKDIISRYIKVRKEIMYLQQASPQESSHQILHKNTTLSLGMDLTMILYATLRTCSFPQPNLPLEGPSIFSAVHAGGWSLRGRACVFQGPSVRNYPSQAPA